MQKELLDLHISFSSYGDKLKTLLDAHASEFLGALTKAAVSFDATTMNGRSHVGLIVFNEKCEYHCVAVRDIEGKKGLEIASVMNARLNEFDGLKEKVSCVISDQCPAQRLGNTEMIKLYNNGREEANKLFQLCCLMHTVINMDNNSAKEVYSSCPETKKAAMLLKIIFGSRKTLGFRRACLKKSLHERIGGPSGFTTDIGSRYAVNFNNGKAVLWYEKDIVEVLGQPNATKDKHESLLSLMNNQPVWSKVRLQLAILVLVWVAVISPFHSQVLKELTYGEIRRTFEEALNSLQSIIQAENSFEVALSIAEEMRHEQHSTTPDAVAQIREHWSVCSDVLKGDINSLTRSAFKKCQTKLSNDWLIIDKLPIGLDVILPWTNR